MSDTLKRYLSVKQVCQQLPVCKSLVYRLIRDGELPACRLGGKILVPLDELRAILEPASDHGPADAPANGDEASPPPAPPPAAPRRRRKGQLDLW